MRARIKKTAAAIENMIQLKTFAGKCRLFNEATSTRTERDEHGKEKRKRSPWPRGVGGGHALVARGREQWLLVLC